MFGGGPKAIRGKKGEQGYRQEQEIMKKKDVPARSNNNITDKKINLEKKIIEKECEKEVQQLDVLKRMKNDPSWDMAVQTLLHCENNPSDAELIATSIIKRRMKQVPPFQNENISEDQ